MKLSEPQFKVLQAATEKPAIDFYDASRVGANGKTLSTLTQKGMLEKKSMPDGSNEWCITAAGREAYEKAAGAKR